jgi:cellulose synthase/poly-beta-1,6-N-acetylglucosamine synthase-like glycosyltransferase
VSIRYLEFIFILFLFLSLYSYGIYQLLLILLSKFKKNKWKKEEVNPKVSILISVYNEERVIREKIKNTQALAYPLEQLEIIVCSDGSTDQTDRLVAATKDSRILLRAFPERAGKTSCLNRVVPETNGEIVVFTDANSMFPSDMLSKIVRNFADPQIGLVTGWTKYRTRSGVEPTSGLYSRLERITKVLESRISSCVGADGAVFAMRKALFQPLREEDINDFVLPLQVVGQGKRVILDPDVFCFEEAARDSGGEFRRQVRITTRTLGAIFRNINYLNPFRFGFFAFFLFSHKVMRFLVPFFLIACFIANIPLIAHCWLYRATLLAQILFVLAGFFSMFIQQPGRVLGLLKFFFMTLAAQLIGWFRVFFGKSDIIWTPQR